ncbi:endoribonuclease (plasmid) [Arthrobacter sp. ZXY-2]|uniref:Rid family hydrolase n=1 Tax=Paenarthrobacter ureafaciens TaxID=37931 RepID=UPI0008A714CE|nr:endoribonuclease [Arthrobacter sp. ZXY-2]
MNRTLVRTSSPYEDKESFARAVVIGDWIYVSQCAGIDYDSQELPSTAAEQTTLSIDNVERALKAVGSSLNDVVRRQVMIPNVDQAEEIMAIVGERFRDASPSNVVFCSPLGAPQYLVEIEVTAYRGIGSAETETIKY